MTDSFMQCEAIKPNGERCRRPARSGSTFCHTHLHYQCRKAEPPLTFRLRNNLWTCADCGRFQRPRQVLKWKDATADGGETLLCEACIRLRSQVEARILDMARKLGGVSYPKAVDALVGIVDESDVKAAWERLFAAGELVSAC